MSDDLDLPQAISLVWKMVKDPGPKSSSKRKTILEMDKVLGLSLSTVERVEISAEIRGLIAEREEARHQRGWEEADRIREELEKRGYILEDTVRGTVVKKKR